MSDWPINRGYEIPKFVQITAVVADYPLLFGLEKDGQVWELIVDHEKDRCWVRVPTKGYALEVGQDGQVKSYIDAETGYEERLS